MERRSQGEARSGCENESALTRTTTKRRKKRLMELQVFNNWNVSLREKYRSYWRQIPNPAFYTPAACRDLRDLFDAEILNGRFFEPSASFWAVDDSSEEPTPVACLVAASVPNEPDAATLFGPFFAPEVADAEKASVARALLEASEKALRAKGFRRVYAGGAPTGSPLLNGVYGSGSPVGFFNDDPSRDFFVAAGYRAGQKSVEWKIDKDDFYVSPVDLPNGWRLAKKERATADWRLAAVERNFSNRRSFCVYGGDGATEASAEAYGAPGGQTAILRLWVCPTLKRDLQTSLKEALLDRIVADASERAPRKAFEICAVVPDDADADEFWEDLDFKKGRRATALVKTLES